MIHTCEFYHFLRAVRGNWRNAIFVYCSSCTYGRQIPCTGFLLAVEGDGKVILLTSMQVHNLTGEEVSPSECCATLSYHAFESAFSKYIEWHVSDPTKCSLRQLCLNPNCRQND